MTSLDDVDIDYVKQIWKSRITIFEMLADRGYKIDIDNEPKSTKKRNIGLLKKFEESWKEFQDETSGMTINEIKNSINFFHNEIYVVWSLRAKLGTNMQDINKDIEEENDRRVEQSKTKTQPTLCTRCIIIIDEDPTYFGKDYIHNLRRIGSSSILVESFQLLELQYNVMLHDIVPHQEICSREEKRLIMREYKVTETKQFPRMQMADPVARYLGARPGALIKITRKSETSGMSAISYRIVY